MSDVQDKRISVIIPALNEEATIEAVVDLAKNSANVGEVIVVDDKSFDNTVQCAKSAGASVITSTRLGKGASMRDGLLVSSGDIVVYLDADVTNYREDLIDVLTRPIIDGDCDFVKARFIRKAGRVTELVARPLLSLLFPDIAGISQPLGGTIAGCREFFFKVNFEDDYGVDIGLLIDMHINKARILEVDIGPLDHKMKPWHQLTKMSRDVSLAILKRAGNLSLVQLDNLETISIIRDQMENAINLTVKKIKKMAIFDLDNTLLNGRFIEKAAEYFDFHKDLLTIVSSNQDSYLITKLIARLLKGKNIAELLAVVDTIPLVTDCEEVIAELHGRGYVVGIITDSYDFVANHIKNKIGADFIMANELEFSSSIATGEVKVPSYFCRNEASTCNHSFCKSNALRQASLNYKIDTPNIIAVGDGENDICMVRIAGIGVSFCSANSLLNQVADYNVSDKRFSPILEFAK